MITIAQAETPGDIVVARTLFMEYMNGLGVDLSFQNVAAELADLPAKYSPPGGVILIARNSTGQPIGCAALRPLGATRTCEIKRLYVKSEARGQDLGRRLAAEIITCAKAAGYARAVLDTLATMQAAQNLYASLGFKVTEPYYDNPVPGTIYMALDL